MRARWYDPTTGQFITSDPIGQASGETNLFAYAGADPINNVDPSGLLLDGLRDKIASATATMIHTTKTVIKNPYVQTLAGAGICIAATPAACLLYAGATGYMNVRGSLQKGGAQGTKGALLAAGSALLNASPGALGMVARGGLSKGMPVGAALLRGLGARAKTAAELLTNLNIGLPGTLIGLMNIQFDECGEASSWISG